MLPRWVHGTKKVKKSSASGEGPQKANRELCGIPVSAAGDKKVKTTAKYFNPIKDIIQL